MPGSEVPRQEQENGSRQSAGAVFFTPALLVKTTDTTSTADLQLAGCDTRQPYSSSSPTSSISRANSACVASFFLKAITSQ